MCQRQAIEPPAQVEQVVPEIYLPSTYLPIPKAICINGMTQSRVSRPERPEEM